MSYDEAKYAVLIDGILRKSDLNTVSAKRIRKQLSEALGYDVSEHKEAINKLIEKRFDKVHEDAANGTSKANSATPPPPTNGANGVSEAPTSPLSSAHSSPAKRRAEDSDISDVLDEPKPKKKRAKKSAEEDDAAFAARLQQEENSRARPTRGGAATKPVKKKTTKKKSATKIKDNSGGDDSDGAEEPKERKGGFHKPLNLSEPLSQLVGETQLSRPQTVKKIWEYVKARDLQDPDDRRQIRCDDTMRAVFKSDRVSMFALNKVLSQHLFPVEE